MIDVFVPGPLTNPMNGSQGGHWSKHSRWARQWRERTAERFRVFLLTDGRRLTIDAAAPKRIAFYAIVFNRFDGDGLEAALKPCRDALKDAHIIDDDRDSAGHVFGYEQHVDRKGARGVRITISPRPAGEEE
jgi:hypothetical protein